MKGQLRLPAAIAVVVLSAAGTTVALTSCGSGNPKPDARRVDAREPDARWADADPCDGIYCVLDGTGSGSGTCPHCADSFGQCPLGCAVI